MPTPEMPKPSPPEIPPNNPPTPTPAPANPTPPVPPPPTVKSEEFDAAEYGERIETGKAIHRRGKDHGYVPGATEESKCAK